MIWFAFFLNENPFNRPPNTTKTSFKGKQGMIEYIQINVHFEGVNEQVRFVPHMFSHKFNWETSVYGT